MDEEERIELQCPLCRATHSFRLLVNRSPVLYNLLEGGCPGSSVKRFRRTFICPDKGEPFEATIAMEQPFGVMVNDVQVF